MKKIYYRKLIRDKIPEQIRAKGFSYSVRNLGQKEFIHELFRKISEEASAFPAIKTRKELIDELTDLTIILDEIKKLKSISPAEFRRAKVNNQKRKGGFRKKLFLVWSSDDKYKSNEKRK